jgi:hypothetical protein
MPLERWIGPEDQGAKALVAILSGMARTALDAALSLPGHQREGAFHLLAADALFTYACEAALEAEDAEGALRSILDRASER